MTVTRRPFIEPGTLLASTQAPSLKPRRLFKPCRLRALQIQPIAWPAGHRHHHPKVTFCRLGIMLFLALLPPIVLTAAVDIADEAYLPENFSVKTFATGYGRTRG